MLKTVSTITEKSLLDNALSKSFDLKLVINKKTPNYLDSFFLINYVQTDPTTNTLESFDLHTEQNAKKSFNTPKAIQNWLLLPIDVKQTHEKI